MLGRVTVYSVFPFNNEIIARIGKIVNPFFKKTFFQKRLDFRQDVIVYRHRERVLEIKEGDTMIYTYNTPNPHGRIRDLLVEEMLLQMEREGKTLPDSREEEE